MKTRLSHTGVEAAVLAFCAWRAADLASAWSHSPFDRIGWLAFLVWLAPVAVSVVGIGEEPAGGRQGITFAWMGLGACVAGGLADTHCLNHIALALACASIAPRSRFLGLWLVLALSWMPALGWVLKGLSTDVVAALRLALSAAAALSVGLGTEAEVRRTTA